MDKKIVAVNIIVSVLILVVIAMIASDVIAYKLSRTFPSSLKKEIPAERTVRRDDLASFSAILEKGLFGKATQGTLTPIAQAEGPAAAAPSDLILLGTAVGSFRETFALILRQSTREERVFRLGDDVFDIGPLVSVRKEEVEIQSGSSRIKILAPSEVLGEAAKTPAASPQGGTLASQVSAGSYVVDQRALNAALDNIGQAMTDARLLPYSEDGKVQGFKVSEVKPGGIFAMVGINNGDTLLRINDFDLDSPEKAMQTLVSLKGQSSIKLDLIRNGSPQTFTYEIK
jgi:general secretion pathway protein C